jgi:hypothetical protein
LFLEKRSNRRLFDVIAKIFYKTQELSKDKEALVLKIKNRPQGGF